MTIEQAPASTRENITRRAWEIARWRPRFSIRHLLILLLVVCAYLACWGPTKNQGIQDVERKFNASQLKPWMSPGESPVAIQTVACLPLVIGLDDSATLYVAPGSNLLCEKADRHYYFWFFGYVSRLPFAREVEYDDPFGEQHESELEVETGEELRVEFDNTERP